MKAPETVNLKRLGTELEESGFDALVAASVENVFYYSGVPLRSALGWEDIPLVLWSREENPTLIVPETQTNLAEAESWIADVRSYKLFVGSPMSFLAEVIKDRGLEGKTLGVEKTFLSAAQHQELKTLLPTTNLVAGDDLLETVRASKTVEEIGILREGFDIAERAIHAGFSEAKVGMTLKEVLDDITSRAAAQGAVRGRSTLLCAAGPEHSEAGAHRLQPGDVIQLDFVGSYKGYQYDIGRTAVVGEPTAEQQDLYQRVWRVARKVAAFMAPGVRAADVYIRGIRAFAEEGLPLYGIKISLGHGIGLTVHDAPTLNPHNRRLLEANMTFCIEPVYMIPGVTFYHIEDLILLTEHGGEVLSELYDTSELSVIGE